MRTRTSIFNSINNLNTGFLPAVLVVCIVAGCSSASPDSPAASFGEPVAAVIALPADSVTDRDTERALQFYITGSIQEEKGNYRDAASAYRFALRHDDDPSIYLALSRVHSEMNEPAAALHYARIAAGKKPEKTEYRKQLGDMYMDMGMLDSAAMEFERIIALDPSDLDSRFALAQLYHDSDPQKALAMYESLQDRIGDDWDLGSRLAELYSNMGKMDKAAEALESLHRIDPGNELVLQTMAGLYAETGKYDRALELYQSLTARSPSRVDYQLGIAEIRLFQRNWLEASQALRRALEMEGLTAADALRIAEIYFQQAMTDASRSMEALDALQTVKDRYPEEWQASWYIGALLFNTGHAKDAIRHFENVLTINPDNLPALDVLSRAWIVTGRYAQAVESLQQLVALGAATTETYSTLGYILERLGRDREAVEALEQALSLSISNLDALSTLGMLYDKLEKFENSDSVYRRAIGLFHDGTYPQDGAYYLILNNYAYALAERGDHLDEAYIYAQSAVEEEPGNSSYLDTIGWIEFKRGNLDAALSYLTKAVELRTKVGESPGTVLLDHLGDIYFALGRQADAAGCWKEALRLDPENEQINSKLHQE